MEVERLEALLQDYDPTGSIWRLFCRTVTPHKERLEALLQDCDPHRERLGALLQDCDPPQGASGGSSARL
ncbi:Sialidase-3 [Dissostichus eleginoides]|uniref:Sialidase-3 n=1 Tax=Dissostichus eleginoides TaxID=100907 RepID=A0AAD9EUT5_DISEL|nr:Sialidase-3 [Dissostichus eleginoides]